MKSRIKTLVSACCLAAVCWGVAILPMAAPASSAGLACETGKSYSVFFAPRREALLSADIKTTVKTIYKEFGEPFAKGEALVQLDDSLFRLELQRCRVLLEAAKVRLDVSQELYRKNSESLLDHEKARMDLALAELATKAALHDVESCRVRAPFDGRVAQEMVHEHEVVEIGMPLMKIVDDSKLRARVLLPSHVWREIRIGAPLAIQVNETGDVIEGKTSHVSAMMDPASGTFEVYAEVDNSKHMLQSGMTGRLVSDGAETSENH